MARKRNSSNRDQSYSRVANFLYEAGTLRMIARSHRQTLMTDDHSDNIASHSFRVTVIGYFLATLEKVDPAKVITMCLFHDFPESRSGDQNWIHKKYVKVFEEEIVDSQLQGLPNEQYLVDIVGEYRKRESVESKIAKDADLLDQILLLKEYAMKGNHEALEWLKGDEQAKRLNTKSGKRLAAVLKKINPSDWWQKLWTEKRR